MSDSDELADAWGANCRINHLVIDAIADAGWLCTLSTRGGRGVAGEFAHVHNLRLAQLEKRAKELAVGIEKLDPSAQPSRRSVRAALKASDKAVGAMLLGVHDGEPKRRGFKRGIYTTLSYFIAHEAHHRGRVLLTLKASGHTLDRTTQMQIWGWDQV